MALMFLSRRKNKRSNLNWSHVKPLDLSVGTLNMLPFEVSKGDVLRFSVSDFVQAMPMKAPLVNGFKLKLEYFFAPRRLYHGLLLLNELGVTSNPSSVVFPSLCPNFPINNQFFTWDNESFDWSIPRLSMDGTAGPSGTLHVGVGVNELETIRELVNVMVQPGSLANLMGFPVGWLPSQNQPSSGGVPFYCPKADDDSFDSAFIDVTIACAYLDIFLNYYVNQQVPSFYSSMYVSEKNTSAPVPDPSVGEVENPSDLYYPKRQVSFLVKDLQDFVNGLKRAVNPSEFIFEWVDGQNFDNTHLMTWAWLCSPASLFQRSYSPYYLESWLQTSFGDAIGDTVKVDVDNGSISFDSVRRASHYQRFLDLAMSGGSRYSDYENAQFDTGHVHNFAVPLYLGSDQHFLGSNVIYQTTGFDSSDSPLGSFAGQSSGGDRHRRRTVRFSEDGYFMVMVSLVPDTIYYRGLPSYLHHLRLDDLYTPALDNVGLEPLPVERLDSLLPVLDFQQTNGSASNSDLRYIIRFGRDIPASPSDQSRAVGFVPAWSDTMQQVSRAYGSLQGDLKYWLLAREYASGGFSEDLQISLDRLVEKYAEYYSSREGFSNSYLQAFRTWLDNLRVNSLYTPYILNHLYNSVFADVSPDAHNFVVTLSFDMTLNREKSKVNIPNTL